MCKAVYGTVAHTHTRSVHLYTPLLAETQKRFLSLPLLPPVETVPLTQAIKALGVLEVLGSIPAVSPRGGYLHW